MKRTSERDERRSPLRALGTLALVGGLAAFAAPGNPAPEAATAGGAAEAEAEAADGAAVDAATWRIRATGARIIGGYGDNFAYDGANVRPLDGTAVMTVDAERGVAELEIQLRTTEESGAIRFSRDASWEGSLRIVQKFDAAETEAARVAQDLYLHGDTGREAPVMPRIYNYFATWGPGTIWVNGEKVVPMIGSHTMFTEEARGETGMILDRDGTVYSPRLPDKEGFTDLRETEFHFVAHTTEPDRDNFPPHTGWIHLHFSDVEVLQKPEGASVPYILDG